MSGKRQDDHFKLEISTPHKADVYMSCHNPDTVAWPLVKALDQAGIRTIGNAIDVKPDGNHTRAIMSGCSGFATVLPYCHREPSTTSPELLSDLLLAVEFSIPLAIFTEEGVRLTVDDSSDSLRLQFGDADPIVVNPQQIHGLDLSVNRHGESESALLAAVNQFAGDVLTKRDGIPPYAFFIGRLERDFTHAREAIRTAVESTAGIPCLWSDDGHWMDIESVHRRTQLLIKHAAFVIADLTLGSESPKRENPSRAHEIGMAIAYNRKLMLCSQEPRRYPYFSIGDMQMVFWNTESDLELKIKEWIHANRESVGRTVLNHHLPDIYADYDPMIKKPCFRYDPTVRYIGPRPLGKRLSELLKAVIGPKLPAPG